MERVRVCDCCCLIYLFYVYVFQKNINSKFCGLFDLGEMDTGKFTQFPFRIKLKKRFDVSVRGPIRNYFMTILRIIFKYQ